MHTPQKHTTFVNTPPSDVSTSCSPFSTGSIHSTTPSSSDDEGIPFPPIFDITKASKSLNKLNNTPYNGTIELRSLLQPSYMVNRIGSNCIGLSWEYINNHDSSFSLHLSYKWLPEAESFRHNHVVLGKYLGDKFIMLETSSTQAKNAFVIDLTKEEQTIQGFDITFTKDSESNITQICFSKGQVIKCVCLLCEAVNLREVISNVKKLTYRIIQNRKTNKMCKVTSFNDFILGGHKKRVKVEFNVPQEKNDFVGFFIENASETEKKEFFNNISNTKHFLKVNAQNLALSLYLVFSQYEKREIPVFLILSYCDIMFKTQ